LATKSPIRPAPFLPSLSETSVAPWHTSRLFSGSTRKRERLELRLLGAIFAHDKLFDVAAQLDKFWTGLQRFVAGIGEGHVDDLLDTGRARRYHDDARGEIDRFLN